jgi:modification target Cys-rich repeat protein
MKKVVYGFGAIVAPSLLGAAIVAGCGEDGSNGNPLGQGSDALCGSCGTIATGDIGISGDARLDGFFKALGTLQNATASIKADFDANIRALAAVYDVEITGQVNAALVGELTAAIEADIDANVNGSLTVNYQPPRCQASVNVALEAQARCEAKADCDVQIDPGEVSVACQGTCSGSCEGSCTGDFACEVQAPSIECEGRCEGACSLETAAACSGTCRGECNGTCSAQDGQGNCAGKCDGTCQGTCELTVAAECSGSCTGKCFTTPPAAGCSAEASCHGSCSGQCSGGCEGNFTPPAASAQCDARADCQASAKAEANASLECTPPQLTLDYGFNGGVLANLDAKAQFAARMTELRVRGIAILQGAAKYRALIDGTVNGEVVFNPSPLAALRTSVTGMANADAFAQFEIAPARIPCTVTAFQEAGTILSGMSTNTTATMSAQADFVAALTGGFSD